LGFLTKLLYATIFCPMSATIFCPMSATCLVHLILLYLTILFFLAESTNYEAPNYAAFSILLLVRLSSV
jgi:hypothetical protein